MEISRSIPKELFWCFNQTHAAYTEGVHQMQSPDELKGDIVVSLDPTWFDGFTVEGSGTSDIIQVVCYGNAWCGHNSHYVSTSRISRKKDGSSLDNYVLALPHVVISTIHVWKNFRRCLTTHSTTGPFYHRTVWGVLSMHYIHGKEPHKHWWTVEHAHRATKILSLNIS